MIKTNIVCTCDKCKLVISQELIKAFISYKVSSETYHLCNDCTRKLISFMMEKS